MSKITQYTIDMISGNTVMQKLRSVIKAFMDLGKETDEEIDRLNAKSDTLSTDVTKLKTDIETKADKDNTMLNSGNLHGDFFSHGEIYKGGTKISTKRLVSAEEVESMLPSPTEIKFVTPNSSPKFTTIGDAIISKRKINESYNEYNIKCHLRTNSLMREDIINFVIPLSDFFDIHVIYEDIYYTSVIPAYEYAKVITKTFCFGTRIYLDPGQYVVCECTCKTTEPILAPSEIALDVTFIGE